MPRAKKSSGPKRTEVLMAPINKIKGAHFNPPERSLEGARLKSLAKEIEEVGLQYPILCTPDWTIIDGHRRLAACKILGWEVMPVLISVSDPARAYSSVNATPMHLSGNNVLYIYMTNPDALTNLQRAKCTRAEEILGINYLKKIYENGSSLQIFDIAKKTSEYCDKDSQAFLNRAVDWLLEHGVTMMRKALEAGTSVHVIEEALKKKTPLRLKYATDVVIED